MISEIHSARCDPNVAAWITQFGDDVYLSVLTLGEIQKGIAKLRGRQPSRAVGLEKWLTRVETEYSGRVIPLGPAEAKCWGELSALGPAEAKCWGDCPPHGLTVGPAEAKCWGELSAPRRPIVDALIGATALVHGLTVATRNIGDFSVMGVPTVNPWADAE